MKKLDDRWAIRMRDDSVAIMQTIGGAAPEDCVAKWPEPSRKEVLSIHPIKMREIPKDRLYRVAWEHDGSKLTINMDKAREEHRRQLRLARLPLLQALDPDYLKALEAGDTEAMAAVVAAKQVLRDAPADPRIDAAKTPAALTALRPDWMGDFT